MTPLLCNSSPISQNGGVAVLCPVAVLGTFPYIDLDGGRQGRSEEGWRVGGRRQGEGGSYDVGQGGNRSGGREGRGRERESKGLNEACTDRGKEGREKANGGEKERGREGATERVRGAIIKRGARDEQRRWETSR